MPWSPADAERHTKKADTPALQELWARVANHELEKMSRVFSAANMGEAEALAIKEANATVAKQHKFNHRGETKRRKI